MLRLRQIFGGSPSRWFMSTRGVSTGMALALALSYTKILGVEKRSVLTFIMVSALILAFLFTSGISLGLRSRAPSEIKDEELFGFLVLVILAGILSASINALLLLFYSQIKTNIPGPIYLVCLVYSFFACVALGYQDALFAMGNLRLATILDFTTVIIQASSMAFFITLGQTSLIISIFLGFILSYVLMTFAIIMIFINSLPFNSRMLGKGMRSILNQSRHQHMFGISNGLVDRIDRFLVGLILPISFIAKYALLTSIISVARFFPDAFIKISLLRHHDKSKKNRSLNHQTIFATLLIGIILVLFTQVFIQEIFGNDWLLPISVGFLFLGQEILRGYYQIKAIDLIALGGKSEMFGISLQLIILSLVFITFSAFTLGLWGVPTAMIFVYLILILQVNNKLRKFARVS